ncbi:MAG TPA: acyl-ACP thioesterase domain-containing protein [Draconibacterium sp.]|nr:acyl-ACP thioesterase domain-containing protein [Draconibacterium sp.]
MKLKHTQELTTKSFFVNRFGKLSTSYLFWQIQDIAWEHAEMLGWGFDNLQKEKRFWVLSRLRVEIVRRPEWGEKFSVETWPSGTEGILALRDIHFMDEKGNSIIKATTSWLVLDMATKRIVRLELDSIPFEKERVLDKNAGKVNAINSKDEITFTPVLFNEIDVNQHFNSGRYLERIIDSYDFDFHETNELSELEVNFVKEGIQDDRLGIKKQIIDKNSHICSVVRESDGADLIRARLVWSQRN